MEPYTPSSHFQKGKADPAFRTKPQLALDLVRRARQSGIPFRAVVAGAFYGENETFYTGLYEEGIGFVMALKPSHSWYRPVGEPGSLLELAEAAPWKSATEPGEWVRVERTFRDGHQEIWWALDVQCRSYGAEKMWRALVVSTDPLTLPKASTWYLVTNLPAPHSQRAQATSLAPASIQEVVYLYGLRVWVEQSYKQTKQTLGWVEYQVRSDRAMRRHWTLVWCAFSFAWWALAQQTEPVPSLLLDLNEQGLAPAPLALPDTLTPMRLVEGGEKKEDKLHA